VTSRSALLAALFVLVTGCGGPADPVTSPSSPAGSPASASDEPTSVLSPTTPPVELPSRLFAPYVEMYTPGRLPDLAKGSGQKHFMLAFLETVDPDSCGIVWNGTTRLDDQAGLDIAADIETLRAAGGDVIPSFGGYAADHEGREIADSCDTAAGVADAYQSVIDALGVTRLDMDIEVESLERPDGIDRRNAAIRLLQDRLKETGRSIEIQYTLPTTPNGPGQDGLAVLRSAVEHGARVDVVNLMAFDYYDGLTTDMADAAISAARGLHRQLATLYPERTDAQLWRMIGLTIMNGVDDYPERTEVTTLDDARAIIRFARDNGLSLLSMWAVQRDNGGCPGGDAADGCSGIEQEDWAFTKLLGRFTRP
jgi:hypothetical protein